MGVWLRRSGVPCVQITTRYMIFGNTRWQKTGGGVFLCVVIAGARGQEGDRSEKCGWSVALRCILATPVWQSEYCGNHDALGQFQSVLLAHAEADSSTRVHHGVVQLLESI